MNKFIRGIRARPIGGSASSAFACLIFMSINCSLAIIRSGIVSDAQEVNLTLIREKNAPNRSFKWTSGTFPST